MSSSQHLDRLTQSANIDTSPVHSAFESPDHTGSTRKSASEDTAHNYPKHSTLIPSFDVNHVVVQSEGNDTLVQDIDELGDQYDYKIVCNWANSPSLNDKQKLGIMGQYPHTVLDSLRQKCLAAHGLRRPTTAGTLLAISEDLNEDNYVPLIDEIEPSPDPHAAQPIYPAYAGHFKTAQDARAHRKRIRIAAKSQAPDIERVKRYGRQYWVRRMYEAMIDITAISDGDSSIHRQRFADSPAFDAADLEATAHHIFDAALAVHERGWNRPSIYHKKVVRGKLTDVSEKSLETRLARICLCLKQKKATVDDAMRGGVTLALLCDNPEARGFTKMSNNTGNKKRGERLRLAKDQKAQQGDDE